MLVRKRAGGKLYAMKVLHKADILKRNQLRHTLTERSVLQSVRHPFIVQMHYSFQSAHQLFLVMSYLSGGELFFHLRREGQLSEPRAQLYAAEICLALQALHQLDVVYRDLKPENILLDSSGHVCLSDFGLAKEAITTLHGGASTFCGTPSYMAPEVLQGTGHGVAVDWWSFGTLIFEMLAGTPPFYSRNLQTMYRAILHGELRFPSSMGKPARALLSALLCRDANHRLGSNGGAKAVQKHAFFRSLDFKKVLLKGYEPSFKPQLTEAADTTNFDTSFTNEPIEDSLHDSSELAAAEANSDLFAEWATCRLTADSTEHLPAADRPMREPGTPGSPGSDWGYQS